MEDARGAFSLTGVVRSVRLLKRIPEEQAAEAGVSKYDRFDYVYTTYGKSSLTPLSHRAEWHLLVGVPFSNG